MSFTALDQDGREVSLWGLEAPPEGNHFCKLCGQPVLPFLGLLRRWHFVHQTEAHDCALRRSESFVYQEVKVRIVDIPKKRHQGWPRPLAFATRACFGWRLSFCWPLGWA